MNEPTTLNDWEKETEYALCALEAGNSTRKQVLDRIIQLASSHSSSLHREMVDSLTQAAREHYAFGAQSDLFVNLSTAIQISNQVFGKESNDRV